jgi:NADPH:quinone reductase-like Zn-dependent oxidoreductase
MAATPASMQALVVTEEGKLSLEHIAVPLPQPKQALVQISHVAQNPTDGIYCPDHVAQNLC